MRLHQPGPAWLHTVLLWLHDRHPPVLQLQWGPRAPSMSKEFINTPSRSSRSNNCNFPAAGQPAADAVRQEGEELLQDLLLCSHGRAV